MIFFGKKPPESPRDKPENTVALFLGDYFRDFGEMYDGGKELLCVMPYYEDDDPTFGMFMRRRGAQLLSQYPLTAEYIVARDEPVTKRSGLPGSRIRHETVDIQEAPWIAEYQRLGGRVLFPAKNTALALSEPNEPKLLPLLSSYTLGLSITYSGYGIRKGHPWGEAGTEEPQHELSLSCYECHDHFLLEISDDPQCCIDQLKEFCREEGRKLIQWQQGGEGAPWTEIPLV